VLFQHEILDRLTLPHRQGFKHTAHGCCFVRVRNPASRISFFIDMTFKRKWRMYFSPLFPPRPTDQVDRATISDDPQPRGE
jgi:hypothetical protein